MSKINWKKYFDHIYCVHFVEYSERYDELCQELDRVGILNSDIFSFKYTFSSPIDKIVYNSPDFSRERDNKKFTLAMYNLAKGHYDCMKESLGRGYKRVLFLEDDVAFLKDLDEIVRILEASPHYDIEMYDKVSPDGLWEYYLKMRPVFIDGKKSEDYVGYSILWTTSCYACSQKGMQHIIKSQEKNFNVADFYINEFSPIKDLSGHHPLVYDGIKRAVSIKNIACQKPAKGESINYHGDTKWVYNQVGISDCGLKPELYNI